MSRTVSGGRRPPQLERLLLSDGEAHTRVLECPAEGGECRPRGVDLVGADGWDDQFFEAAVEGALSLGDQRGPAGGEADQRRAPVSGVREPGHISARFEPVDSLADRADPSGEGRGDVGDARAWVVAKIAQGLEPRSRDPVLGAELFTDGVVEAGLAADQVVEEARELLRSKSSCHGIYSNNTCHGM